jgi:formyl-CoA transferase
MKEIADDKSLYETGTLVEVDHPVRGKYIIVGNPIKLSDYPTTVERSPLLGEHTGEVLAQLGYGAEELAQLREQKVI